MKETGGICSVAYGTQFFTFLGHFSERAYRLILISRPKLITLSYYLDIYDAMKHRFTREQAK